MSARGIDQPATGTPTPEELRAAERADFVRLVLLVAIVAALAFALAWALRDPGIQPGLGAVVAAGVLAWPPRGDGIAGTPAFAPAACPVLTTCRWCGTELGYGPEATRLQVELRVCSRCPPDGSKRRAMTEGITRGAADAAACDRNEEHPVFCPPYPIGTAERSAWRDGWAAGFHATDPDRSFFEAQVQQAVTMGWLRPSGGGAQ